MLKITYLTLLFIFSSNLALFSQTHLEYLISQGVELSYNLKLDEAEEIYNKVIEIYPDQPYGYHYIAQNHLWSYLGSKDEGEYGIFISYSDMSITKAEELLDEEENDYKLRHLLGWAYTNRAMGFTAKGNSLDAFWASKNAVGYFEETLELNPEYYDAYLGLGIFDYALSFVPGIFKWALSLTGLSYDKDKGVEYIRTAYAKGNHLKTEASFHLSKIYIEYLAEFDSAANHLNQIIKKYPLNSLFHYQRAILMIEARDLNAAEESLNKVLDLSNPKFRQTNAFSFFLKGEIYFKRNQFNKAIEYYTIFIDTTRSLDYTGAANLKLAICYHVLGDDEKSNEHLMLSSFGNQDIFDDKFAIEESEYLFEEKFNKEYIILVKAKNFLESGSYDSLNNFLLANIDSITNKEFKGAALTYLSESFMEEGEYPKALNYANDALKNRNGRKKWIYPYANYIISKSYFELGELDSASLYLEKSVEFTDYGYEEKLEPHFNNLKRKLNKSF